MRWRAADFAGVFAVLAIVWAARGLVITGSILAGDVSPVEATDAALAFWSCAFLCALHVYNAYRDMGS